MNINLEWDNNHDALLAHDILALEAGVLSNITDKARSFFTSFVSNLIGSTKFLDTTGNEQVELPKDYHTAIRIAKTIAYTDWMDVVIMKPANFKGSLLLYSQDMLESIKTTKSLFTDGFQEFNNVISVVVTNPSKSNYIPTMKVLLEMEKHRNHVSTLLAKYHGYSNEFTMTPFKTVFQRMIDLEPFFKYVITMSNINTPEYITSVKKETDTTVENMKMFIDVLEKRELSNEIITYVSKGSIILADYVQMVSLLYHENMVLNNVTNDIIDHLRKNL